MQKKKLIVGICGASGSVYAKLFLNKILSEHPAFSHVAVVKSDNAEVVWKTELQEDFPSEKGFVLYGKNDFNSPVASGSSGYRHMVIIPCSMGTLGRIAAGISNDLITRAADVVLKERGKLILVTRETPLSLIHLNNMRTLAEAGAIICPASPSFYSVPSSIEEACMTVVNRVVDLLGEDSRSFRWGES